MSDVNSSEELQLMVEDYLAAAGLNEGVEVAVEAIRGEGRIFLRCVVSAPEMPKSQTPWVQKTIPWTTRGPRPSDWGDVYVKAIAAIDDWLDVELSRIEDALRRLGRLGPVRRAMIAQVIRSGRS